MNKLSRKQCSAITKTPYADSVKKKKEEETQRHLLQKCNKIPWTRKYDINYDNAFSDADLEQTREAAQCTQELCSILEENPPPWKQRQNETHWIPKVRPQVMPWVSHLANPGVCTQTNKQTKIYLALRHIVPRSHTNFAIQKQRLSGFQLQPCTAMFKILFGCHGNHSNHALWSAGDYL